MKKIVFYAQILALMVCGLGVGNAATLTFNNGFESGNLTGFSCSGNCPSVNGSSKMTGNYGGDFVLTRSMSVPYRTEVTFKQGGNNLTIGGEYWIGINFKHVDWQNDSDSEISPFQVHVIPANWDNPECPESAVAIAPFYMISQSGTLKFQTYGGKLRWSGPIHLNTWRSVVVRYIPSKTSDGLIEAWIDGVKVTSVSGQNVDLVDKCNQPYQDRTYLKMGIYKWNWKAGRPATGSTRRQIHIDNVKIASGSDGYSQVSTNSSAPDTTPPIISGESAATTANSATITWQTNEPADSLLEYGPTTSYGGISSNSSFVTSHSRTITGLQSSTLYHYRVKSKDPSGNLRTGTDKTFTTGASDTTPPVLSNIECTPTATSATCTWTTNEASNSEVRYGLTSSYGLTKNSSTMVTSHSLTLTGLSPETTYHYQVRSTDSSNNTQTSLDFTFTTAAVSSSDTTPPVISNLNCTPTENSATCTWSTNEASSTKINYGLTSSYGSVYNNANLVTSHSATLSGLPPETTYHFQAQSTDASNNTGSSADTTFTTLPHVETTPTVHQPVVREDPCK